MATPILARYLFIAFLVCVAPLSSQTASATFSGYVTDPTGAAVTTAVVQMVNQDTNVSQTTQTNQAGVYLFPSLPPGRYRVSVKAAGFKEVLVENLVLHVQDTVSQNFQLELGPTAQSVTVSGEAALVNTQDAAVGTVVERQIVADMPLNGRSFQGLITLTPGVVTVPAGTNTPGQFVVNGQRSDTNYFMVDGVSGNVAAPTAGSVNANGAGGTPAASSSGGFNNLVSIDALQEFRITTSNFAPEFGRTPGGQISLSSRSGTNAFHGDVFDYLRNTVLDANDWFLNSRAKPRGIVQQNDFGGVVGGPLRKNKLFFFTSYEGLRLNAPSPSVKVVPTQAARAAAAAANDNGVTGYMAQFLNAYPLPDGNPSTPCTTSTNCFASFTGSFPGTSNLDATSARIDYSISERMSVFGRYSHSPSSTTTATSVASNGLLDGNDAYTAGWTWILTNALNNDLRFNFTHTTFVLAKNPLDFKGDLKSIFPSGFAQPPSSYTLPQMAIQIGTGIANFDTFQLATGNANNGNDQRNITDSFGWIKGSHSFKFGFDYRQLDPSFDQSNFNWNTQFALTIGSTPNYCPGGTVPGYICGIASLANIQHNVPQHFRFRQWSSFVQDTWKVTHRLTLTYGLRWEVNPAVEWTNGYPGFSVSNTHFNLSNMSGVTLNSFGTPAFQTRWGDVSPRLGIAYQLSTDPKWGRVIRGGYGVFYDTGSQAFALASAPWNARFNNLGPPVIPVQFPVATANAAYLTPPVIPNPPVFPLYLQTDNLIDPNYNLPYVHEANITLEQQLGSHQSLTASYVGAFGRRLLGVLEYPPNRTNPQVLGNGTVGDTMFIFGNYSSSSYNSLQTRFQRQFAAGLGVLASYTWSHSIDNGSLDASLPLQTVPTAASLSSAIPFNLLRASSDFDIRQALALSAVYNIPSPSRTNRLVNAIFGHWSVDPIYHYQTPIPLEIMANNTSSLGGAASLGQRPNLIPGVPIYVSGADCAAQNGGQGCPGGMGLNSAPVSAAMAASAGCVAPTAANAKGAFCTPLPIGGQAVSGNFGRNVVRAFPLQEFDLSLHREFPIGETVRVRFQADMFNVFNHPSFGPEGLNGACNCATLNSPSFVISSSMANSTLGSSFSTGSGFNPIFNTGGPRNFQFALKVFF